MIFNNFFHTCLICIAMFWLHLVILASGGNGVEYLVLSEGVSSAGPLSAVEERKSDLKYFVSLL